MDGSFRGHLDMLILAVLASGPAHGYAQIEALRGRSGGTLDIPEGSLYPALHRLEADGFVRSHWEQVNGRKRRVYELTVSGSRSFKERWQTWAALREAIDSVLGGPAWLPAT
jgi:DNA-binding PadR family transcriptional regulator